MVLWLKEGFFLTSSYLEPLECAGVLRLKSRFVSDYWPHISEWFETSLFKGFAYACAHHS